MFPLKSKKLRIHLPDPPPPGIKKKKMYVYKLKDTYLYNP